MPNVTIYLNKNLYDKVRDEVRGSGKTESKIVQKALKEHYKMD